MGNKVVSVFQVIGIAILFVFLSWLFREIIGYLTLLALMIFTVFTFILDTFLLFTGLDGSFGISKSYVEMCIGSHLIYAWIFWDVLIGAPILFIYISCCIESGSLLFGPSKSQPEHIKTIYTLSGNAPEDKWMRRHREKQAKRAKKAAKQNGVTNSTRNNRYYVDKKNNWLTNTPTRWQSNK